MRQGEAVRSCSERGASDRSAAGIALRVFAARRLAEERPDDLFREIFDRVPLLVPVHRSSLRVEGGIWPALNIASALARAGVGCGVLTALERIAPIAKSAFAARGSRPRPIDHYETIRATRLVTDRPELCLVDDVVTKGSTLIAAASRLAGGLSGGKNRRVRIDPNDGVRRRYRSNHRTDDGLDHVERRRSRPETLRVRTANSIDLYVCIAKNSYTSLETRGVLASSNLRSATSC